MEKEKIGDLGKCIVSEILLQYRRCGFERPGTIMQSRWFNAAVVLLWLATMGWLVTVKVLPSLFIGEPPSYSKIVEARRDAPPVGWRMTLNEQSLGWALSDSKLQSTDLTDIHSRVHFESFPLEEVMPNWVRSLVKLMHRSAGQLELDASSTLVIDPLGHLLRFDSSVYVDPLDEIVNISGTVDGRSLHLVVRSGDASFANDTYLPSNALLTDALSPQAVLPGLREGQKWTMPVYSPLWPSKNPMEIVHAKVEGIEPILWDGEMRQCWLVVYHSDSESGAGGKKSPRGKLWVRLDGPVLRQQIQLFDSTIRFDRLSDKDAQKLAEEAGPQWWVMESQGVSPLVRQPPLLPQHPGPWLHDDRPPYGIRFPGPSTLPSLNDSTFVSPPRPDAGTIPAESSSHGPETHPQDADDD